jgi:hypothetical protein
MANIGFAWRARPHQIADVGIAQRYHAREGRAHHRIGLEGQQAAQIGLASFTAAAWVSAAAFFSSTSWRETEVVVSRSRQRAAVVRASAASAFTR